jgi:O-antigen ligase
MIMRFFSRENINYYLFVIWAAVIPSGFYIANFTLAVLLLISSFTLKRSLGYQAIDKSTWFPLALYCMVLIGFFFSHDRREALSALSMYLPYVIVPIAISYGPHLTNSQFQNIFRAFILSLCISLLACDLYAIGDILITGKGRVMLNEIYNYHKLSSFGLTRLFDDWHPTYVATFIIWSLLLLMQPGQNKPLFRTVPGFLLAGVLLTNLFLLNSIAALLALVITGALLGLQLLLRKGVGRVYLFVIISIILLSTVALIYFNPIRNEKIATLEARGLKITDAEGERNFLTIRLAKWLVHADVFRNHPVFGTSPGDIKSERKLAYYYRGFINLGEANYNAHNQYLDILCRFGLTGFVLFMCWLLWPIHWKKLELYEYFLISSAIIFLTESFLERQQGLFAFLFFYAVLTKRRREQVSSISTSEI